MNAIQELLNLDITSVFSRIVIILFAIVAMYELIGKVSIIINKPVSWVRKKNEDHELLMQTISNLSNLTEKQKSDVEQSIRHDKLIKEDLSKVVNTLNIINDKLDAMEKKTDDSERAKLKDRIAQAYRKHHESGEWTRMDKEAYEGLIRDYEAHGGKNSFVHDICEPESFTWKIID